QVPPREGVPRLWVATLRQVSQTLETHFLAPDFPSTSPCRQPMSLERSEEIAMATSKRKSTAKPSALEAAAKGPFKTKRSTAATKPVDNVLTPPPAVAEAVDAFRAAQDQARYYEGEMAVHKNTILEF